MPVRENREYRAMSVMQKRDDDEYIVEGYATTFNDPYVMWQDEDITYYESVDARAFDTTDMSDCIFQFNHDGMVYARTKNDTLKLNVDKHGLHVVADLSKTADARNMYENIACGNVCQMSFAFTVSKDEYDRKSHTRNILGIGKLYDVSAVSIPANPGTEISARDYFGGIAEEEKAERLRAEALEEKRTALREKIKNYMGENSDGTEGNDQ